jgi:hypothetical protein
MAVVCEVNPFMAEWGNVGKKWLEVCTKTRKAMACVSHSNSTIQNKVTALLEYQKVHCVFMYLSSLSHQYCFTLTGS